MGAGDKPNGSTGLRPPGQQGRRTRDAAIEAIARTAAMHDASIPGKSPRVALLASAIARELRHPDRAIRLIYLAGIVHDIGEIRTPAELFSKPGRLSEIERQLLQAHARASYDIVKGFDVPSPIPEIVLQHHERLDGSGYPQGLCGDGILPAARILAVADVVEAMVSARPHRPALSLGAALAEIEKYKAQRYDRAAADACVELFLDERFSFPEMAAM